MTYPSSRAAGDPDRRRMHVRRARLLPIWLAVALPALAAAQPGPGSPWTTLPPPNEAPAPNAGRGFAVALDGDRAVVGARFDGPTGAGRVYVFSWNGNAWIEETPPLEGVQPGDQFGSSVALHGDTLAVGAVGEERDGQLPTGMVHLFVLVGHHYFGGQSWCELSTVVGQPGVRQVGRAVALDAGWLAVAGTADLHDGESGIVRVYPLTPLGSIVPGSVGEHLASVDLQPGDRFGESLAMGAGALVVGAPAHRDSGGLAAAGAAYVYVPALPPAASLLPVATLQAPDAVADGNFGSAVTMSGTGDTLAVGAAGAPWPSPGIGRPGAVYVFASGAGVWTQQARLAPSPAFADAGDRFGQAVALDGLFGGLLLIVGAPQHGHDHRAPASGAAFFFVRDRAGIWAGVPVMPPAPPANALYGFAVALSQTAFLVGAPLASGGAGSAFAFRPSTDEAAAARATTAHAAQPTTAAPTAAACSAATVSFAGVPVPP